MGGYGSGRSLSPDGRKRQLSASWQAEKELPFTSNSLRPGGTVMRFLWLTRPQPARAPWAELIATVLTLAAIMTISQPLVPLYHTQRRERRAVETSPREVLTFLVPAHSPRAVRSSTRATERILTTPTLPRNDTAGAVPVTPLPASQLSEPTVPAESGSATPLRGVASPATRPLGPRWAPSGISTARPLTVAARDSMLAQISSDVPRLAKTQRPTQAETDSILREQSMIERAARELNFHVAPPTIGAAVSVSLGFLSPVPSRKQQVRDSVVNAQVQRQIAVITERARAKQDSLRRADSIARRRRAQSDSSVPPPASNSSRHKSS